MYGFKCSKTACSLNSALHSSCIFVAQIWTWHSKVTCKRCALQYSPSQPCQAGDALPWTYAIFKPFYVLTLLVIFQVLKISQLLLTPLICDAHFHTRHRYNRYTEYIPIAPIYDTRHYVGTYLKFLHGALWFIRSRFSWSRIKWVALWSLFWDATPGIMYSVTGTLSSCHLNILLLVVLTFYHLIS